MRRYVSPRRYFGRPESQRPALGCGTVGDALERALFEALRADPESLAASLAKASGPSSGAEEPQANNVGLARDSGES